MVLERLREPLELRDRPTPREVRSTIEAARLTVVRSVVALALLLAPLTAHADDCDHASIWRDGKRDGTVCRADAAASGLTVIDLSEDWTPPVLAAADRKSVV